MPKAKKGKKKSLNKENEIKTTLALLQERKKCMVPRLGDKYYQIIQQQNIKQQNAIKVINDTSQGRNTEKTNINLSGHVLGSVPIEISNVLCPTKILELDLSKNNLFHVNELFTRIQSLINLEVLNLSKNKLMGPLSEISSSFTNLRELRIDENHITALPENSDEMLWCNLKIFSASYNELQNLPSSSVIGWTNLIECNLRRNQLENLPDTISNWKNLRYLLLSNNKLNNIPESIKALTSLKVLEVKSNSLEKLPLGLVDCKNVEFLNIADNKLTTIPDELFLSMNKLIELELYKNKITMIPPTIGNLKQLTTISLSNNNLKELPEEIGNLQNLKEIYVNNNASFTRVPNSIGNLSSLTELQLRGCTKLKTLPNTLAECTNLKELDMRKKASCKLPAKLYQSLEEEIGCTLRGCVSKNAKKSKK